MVCSQPFAYLGISLPLFSTIPSNLSWYHPSSCHFCQMNQQCNLELYIRSKYCKLAFGVKLICMFLIGDKSSSCFFTSYICQIIEEKLSNSKQLSCSLASAALGAVCSWRGNSSQRRTCPSAKTATRSVFIMMVVMMVVNVMRMSKSKTSEALQRERVQK